MLSCLARAVSAVQRCPLRAVEQHAAVTAERAVLRGIVDSRSGADPGDVSMCLCWMTCISVSGTRRARGISSKDSSATL
jgi:hypothetical protein